MSPTLFFLPLIDILRPVATFMGLALTLQGLNTVVRPAPALTFWGLPPAVYAHTALVPVMASRNTFMGLTFLALSYLGMDRAAGVVYLIGAMPPAWDYFIAEKYGRKGSGMNHAVGAVVIGAMGGGLLYAAER